MGVHTDGGQELVGRVILMEKNTSTLGTIAVVGRVYQLINDGVAEQASEQHLLEEAEEQRGAQQDQDVGANLGPISK